jgi:hypothetical protein
LEWSSLRRIACHACVMQSLGCAWLVLRPGNQIKFQTNFTATGSIIVELFSRVPKTSTALSFKCIYKSNTQAHQEENARYTTHLFILLQSGTQSLASDRRMLLYLFLVLTSSLRCPTHT